MSFYKTQTYMNVRHIELKYLVCLIFSCTRVILVWRLMLVSVLKIFLNLEVK